MAIRKLRGPGNTWPHRKHLSLALIIGGDKLRRLWPRADQAHLASQHVDELRQLIHLRQAQNASNRGNPGIGCPGNRGPHTLGAYAHRSELIHAERLAISSHSSPGV